MAGQEHKRTPDVLAEPGIPGLSLQALGAAELDLGDIEPGQDFGLLAIMGIQLPDASFKTPW